MTSSLKQRVIDMINMWDLDGDLNDYAYESIDTFRMILDELILEETTNEQ